MALAYGQKPRIVVEESPLARMFADLPSTILSFMQLNQQMQHRAEEAEKDRQFKESQLYLKDLLGTRRMLQKGLIDTNKVAVAKNLSLDIGFDNLIRNNPEHSTSGGPKVKQDYVDLIQQDVNSLYTELEKADNQLALANLGAQHAIAIDRDFSGATDTKELGLFQKENPELFQELGMDGFPQAYITGVNNTLLQPAVRTQQKAQKKIYDTGRVLEALNQVFPNNPNLGAANAMFLSDPGSAKVIDEIGKVYTEQPDVVGKIKKDLQATDVTFRNYMEGLESSRAGVDEAFLKGLPIQGTEDYKAKSLMDPKFVSSMKKDLSENFATWFSGKTREGKSYGSDPIDWIKDEFNTKGGWDDTVTAVDQVMAMPEWQNLISNPDKLTEAFNWEGKGDKEEKANNFFLKSIEAYNLIDDIEGKGVVYSPLFLETIGAQRTAPGTPADTSQVTVPADTSQVTVPVGTGQVTTPVDSSRTSTAPAVIDTGQAEERILTPFEATKARRYKPVYEALDYFSSLGARGKARSRLEALGQYQQTAVSEEPFSEELYTAPIGETYDDPSATLIDLAYVDPNVSSELSGELRGVLDSLKQDSQVRELVNIITNSPNIQNEFAQTGKTVDVVGILEQWKKEGYPDIGEFIMDEFPEVEPEFIR